MTDRAVVTIAAAAAVALVGLLAAWRALHSEDGRRVRLLVPLAVWWLRPRAPLFGPLVRYEWLRLTRRGQFPALRAGLVLVLLAGLFVTYLREGAGLDRAGLLFGGVELPRERLTQFGETFLIAFLIVQLVAVLAMTPVIAASALGEEKERGTLDFLRATALSSREIVLGKFAARVLYLAGVVAAGLPVLALTTLFGGVDIATLLAGYLVASVALFALAAQSVLLSVRRAGLREVLVGVYGRQLGLAALGTAGCCIPGLSGCSPVTTLAWVLYNATHPGSRFKPGLWTTSEVAMISLGVFALSHAAAAVWALTRATQELGREGPPHAAANRVEEYEWELVRHADDDPQALPWDHPKHSWRPVVQTRVPPFDGSPLLWKERTFGRRGVPGLWGALGGLGPVVAALVLTLTLWGFIVLLDAAMNDRQLAGALNGVVGLGYFVVVAFGSLTAGVRAAATVARERERQTLDGLLSLPGGRAEVLHAKWLAPLLLWRKIAGFGLAVAAVITLVGGLFPLALVTTTLQAAGAVVLANTLGLWLSVRCKTVTRATAIFVALLLTSWIAPLALAPLAGAVVNTLDPRVPDALPAAAVAQLSAPVGVWTAGLKWSAYRTPYLDAAALARQAASAAAGLAMLGASWLLWRHARRGFERAGK